MDKVYALVGDYGYEGERFYGVFSSEEKAKAATFNISFGGTWHVVPCDLDTVTTLDEIKG